MRHRVLDTVAAGRLAKAIAVTRSIAGGIFVAFAIGKFTAHSAEVDSFRTYGLPEPDTFVYAIGCLEIVGGALLIAGLLTRLAALALAGDMAGAIVVSGIAEGEVISYTLAPALLVTMIVLLRTGAGAASLDARLS